MNAKRMLTHWLMLTFALLALLLVLLWPVSVRAQNPCEICLPGSSPAFSWPAISALMIVNPLFREFVSRSRTPNTKCIWASDQER